MDDWRVVHLRLGSRGSRRRRQRRRLRCRRRRSLQSRRRRWCRRRTMPVHLHRLSVPRRCRGMHLGRVWRDREHRGRAWCSRDHRKRCWCAGKTCRKRTDRKRWLNHRVSRKHRLQLGVRRRCGGGGVGEIRLVGDQNAARGEVKASVPLVVRGVPEEHTTSRAGRHLGRSGGGGVSLLG